MRVDDDKKRQKAEMLMGLLADVMNEDGSDKSSKAYELFRKLDTCLRDRLYVELNRFGLGEGLEVAKLSRLMLQRIETACRFPELMRGNLICLEVPYVNQAFCGLSSGLIKAIPEIGAVRTSIPALAIHGKDLKIEYVNYADNRRRMSLRDYSLLNDLAYRIGNLQLRRLIKNFIVTAPQVSKLSAVLITRGTGRQLPVVERLQPFLDVTVRGRPSEEHLDIRGTRVYLGLREQLECVDALVRSGLWQDEHQSRIVSKAITEDLIRRDGGDDDERAFFGRYRDEVKLTMKQCREELRCLEPILKSSMEYMEAIRKEFNDFYNKRKRLPRRPDYVTESLCRIIEVYKKTGQAPVEYLERLRVFGIDPDTDGRVRAAVKRGQEAYDDAHRLNAEELIEEGEKKLKVRRAKWPVRPTDVQLVPFKMAAAYGDVTALARLAGIFYDSGRYMHNRRISDSEEVTDAQTLKFILQRLVERGCDVEVNRKRILHIRKCLGEYEEEAELPGPRPKVRTSRHESSLKIDSGVSRDEEAEHSYDEKQNYRPRRTYVGSSSRSCCFVTTAAMGALSVGKYERVKAFLLMKRLRDSRMLQSDRGRVLLSTYYKIAPLLVREINSRADSARYYWVLWRQYILPCCHHVREGQMEEAERVYTDMIKHLLFSQ